jgi:hypothetical protein
MFFKKLTSFIVGFNIRPHPGVWAAQIDPPVAVNFEIRIANRREPA